MIVVLLLALTFSSPTFTSVVNYKDSCSAVGYKCSDGSCISFNSICDGLLDCLDGSDEKICIESYPLYDFILNQSIHETQSCRADEYKCSNGSCISFISVCDGLLDCLDGSDEKICTDSGEHKCDNGQVISTEKVCDGKSDCADGSDETLKICAGNRCASYLFQCAYGACVDEGSNCNGTEECADGSDESDEICNRTSPGQPTSPVTPIRPPLQGGNCVLPPYPINGTYTVNNNPAATPGKRYPSVKLQISCNAGFQVENNINSIFCVNGEWSSSMPKCVPFCKLHKHLSVEYRCVVSGLDSLTGSRECGSLEPSGTVATPICKSPNYYSTELLTNMHCVEGTWDYIATCKPSLTNISIIINDIEIVVTSNNAQVTVNNYGNNKINIVNNFQNAQNIVIEHNRRPSSSRTTTSTTTENNSVYDIDETDWRMGQAK